MADKGLKVFTDYKNKILEAFVSGDTPLVRAIANNDVDFMSKHDGAFDGTGVSVCIMRITRK